MSAVFEHPVDVLARYSNMIPAGQSLQGFLGGAMIAKDALDSQAAGLPVAKSLKALCVHDLAKREFKKRAPILHPIINSQDLCMVFAPRGIGKTHFAMGIIFAVATGGSFGKWKANLPRKVIYLDGELPGDVLKQRLAMHTPDIEPNPDYLKVFTPDLLADDDTMPDLCDLEGQSRIEAMIEHDTALIVIDNLSAWCRTGRENEGESWTPIADWLLRLRRRGIAVLLIHHSGKGGDQRGSSKREDLLDLSIKLERSKDYDPQQGAAFNMIFSKARHLTGEDAQGLEFSLIDTDGRASWAIRTLEASTYERVVELAREGLSQGEICSELELHKSNVSRAIRKARDQGDLPREAKK
jgi:hypothetical protein